MLGDRLLRDVDLLGPSESEQQSAQCTHNSRGYGRKDEAAAILSDNLDLRSREASSTTISLTSNNNNNSKT